MDQRQPGNLTASRSWGFPLVGIMNSLHHAWKPLLLIMLIGPFTVIFFSTQDPHTSTESWFYCSAEGNVAKRAPGVYNFLWDPHQYFTINITFGQLSFTSAKIIDACWDAIVGRGGQVLAGLSAYKVLRRSFTLTMETCEITIPTVASVYCEQMQLTTAWRLLRGGLCDRRLRPSARRGPSPATRARLVIQAFACLYVLAFATFVSVMTGYRTELKGIFDYTEDNWDRVKPIDKLFRPRMILHDGIRVGLDEGPTYFSNELKYPAWEPQFSDKNGFTLGNFTNAMQYFDKPLGVLVECKSTCSVYHDYLMLTVLRTDYFTCLGALYLYNSSDSSITSDTTAMAQDTSVHNESLTSLSCATKKCSCSIPHIALRETMAETAQRMISNITIKAKSWELEAPPLNIGLSGSPGVWEPESFNTTEYWAKFPWIIDDQDMYRTLDGSLNDYGPVYVYNSTTWFDEDTIKGTGRCVAEENEAYSWGFSAQLLLTFCCCTAGFAITLIALQIDVFCNSRSDREHLPYSIYTDVIYLAEELKSAFGYRVKEHLRSPAGLEKKVAGHEMGLCLDVGGLKLSRWQEWKRRRSLRAEIARGKGGL